jgi:rubrerythrin
MKKSSKGKNNAKNSRAKNARSMSGGSKGRNSRSAASNSRNGHARSASSSRSRQNSNGRQAISEKWLKDFLSEMFAVEQGGVKLYQKALDALQHDELRDKLEEFHQETERHVELVQELMQAAGVEDGYLSPGAKAAEHKAEGLLSTEIEEEDLRDMNNIENLVLAETKDHWNWEMLNSIAAGIQEREVKDAAKRACSEVFKQEREHLQWNEETLTALAMEKAHEMESGEGMERESEESGEGSEQNAEDNE